MLVSRFVYAKMRLSLNGAGSAGRECTVLLREIHPHLNGSYQIDSQMTGRTDVVFNIGIFRDSPQFKATVNLPFAAAAHLVNVAGFDRSAQGEIINLTEAGVKIHRQGFVTRTGFFEGWERPENRPRADDPEAFI